MKMDNYKVIDVSRTLTPGQERFKLELKTFFVDEYVDYVKREDNDWYIIGVDAEGIENSRDIKQPIHRLLLERDIPIIEEMENLESIKAENGNSWQVSIKD